MISNGNLQGKELQSEGSTSSLLILDDGRVLARNVTPALSNLLHALFPQDEALALRVALTDGAQTSIKTPPFTQQS